MNSKYNSRNKFLRATESKLNNKQNTIEVEVMSDPDTEDPSILIADWNGIVLPFPKSLIRANDLVIKDGRMKISTSMYDTWFREKHDAEIELLSEKIYSHFDKIMEHSHVIMNDQEFRNIRLPFLKSTILYSGELHYPLGAMLEAWMEEDDDLSVSSTAYMLKINVSPLSGLNNYTAYSTKTRSLITGSLSKENKSWREYIGKFQSIASSRRNKSDLLAITRLSQLLKID
jgi:hypothetical protein